MFKKTITYEDYNGISRTEDFYFNLNRSELTKLELSQQSGYGAMMQRIIDANDGPAIMEIFDKIVRMAYGVKSEDGRRFMKSEAISDEFMELCTDSKAAANFINGIIPADLREQAQENVVDMARKN
jgi:hypothetical protein